MLEIGAARVEITAFEPGLGMMGWGYPRNRALGVAMPLHARAFVLHDPQRDRRLALVVADLCFISQAVRQGVLERLQAEHAELGLDEHRLLLSATHTHSGPGGTSHYVFYNTNAFGFSAPVYRRVVDGIVEAIVQAAGNAQPGRVQLRQGEIPVDQPVAFNRAVEAFNANPEIDPKVGGQRPAEAADRTMTLLRFEDADGRPLGALNWFAVHATSVHRDNNLLHPDNKGCAAVALEAHGARAHDRPDFVAGFAQGACGDISPNFRYHAGRGLSIGIVDDDFEAARRNGAIQADHARQLLEADEAGSLEPRLDGGVLYVDFSALDVDPRFSDGRPHRTAPAEIGLRMLFGTAEGPGLPYRLTPALGRLAGLLRRSQQLRQRLRRDGEPPQGNKIPFLETGRGSQGRTFRWREVGAGMPLPGWVDPFVAHIKKIHAAGGIGPHPWTPQVLPVQLLVVGRLAIAAVPAEFTTVSGMRLRQSVLERLRPAGVDTVVLAGYANAYAGYVTTHQEYQLQGYEGASTHFGPWTLAGYQTAFDRLASRLLLTPEQRPRELGATPPRFDPEELARRAFSA